MIKIKINFLISFSFLFSLENISITSNIILKIICELLKFIELKFRRYLKFKQPQKIMRQLLFLTVFITKN